jgi:hypothetical protein
METNENSNLDLLKLYKESLSKLTVPVEAVSASTQSVQQSLMTSFLKGEKVVCIKEKEFVSPFLIEDLSNQTCYPMLFFKVSGEGNLLFYDKSLPVFNSACLDLLQGYGLKIKSINFSDIEVIYERIENLIVANMMIDKLRLVPYFHFVDCDVLEYNQNFPFLKDYIFGDIDNEKYASLFKEMEDSHVEKKLTDNTFGFFARNERVFHREESYSGSSVFMTEESIFDNFIVKCVTRNAKRRQSVLFLTAPEDKKKVEDALSRFSLMNYVDEEKYRTSEELSEKLLSIFEKDGGCVKDTFSTVKNKREQYFSFLRKRDEAYHSLQPFKQIDYFNEFRQNNIRVLNLNLEGYDSLERKRDENFFDVLKNLSSIREGCLTDHPYYGLTVTLERENYSRLQLILINLIKLIRQFNDEINRDDVVQRYALHMNSMNSFYYIRECGRILSQYNGFPRKYFHFSFEEEEKYPLSELKRTFQAISSAKLFLSNVCFTSLLSMDLVELMKNLESDNFFVRRKARKALKEQVRSPKETDLDSIIHVLQTYLNSRQHIRKILPVYREIYGDSVLTMNGVVEIQSNLEYVRKFHSFQEEHPNFNSDHPFIKRALRDKAFRLEQLARLERISGIYENIKENLTKYVSFYRDVNNDDLYDTDFDSLLERFNTENLNSYDEFFDYVSFIKAKSEASRLLSIVIQRYIRNHWPLSTLKDDFSYSIIYQAYQEGRKKFDSYDESFNGLGKEVLSSLSQIEAEKKQDYQNRYVEFLKEVQENPDSRKILSHMKEEELPYLTQEKEYEARRLLSHTSFAFVSTYEELYHIPEDLFDHVVILNSFKFSNLNLISAYRIAKKRIFISYGDENDKRTQAYHETVLSRDNMCKKTIPFNMLKAEFLSKFCDEAHEKGFEVRMDDSSFPLLCIKDGNRYGILPDVLLDSNVDQEGLMELRNYLARFENVKLVVIDTYGYLFSSDNVLDYLSK